MASVTVFISSQNTNAKVSPPLSELQVLNEQLFQTLAKYISSMSVLMSMNFQYILKLTLVVGHFSYQHPLVLRMFLLLQSSEQKPKTSTNNTRVKMAFAGTLLGIRVCLKISI